MSGVLASLSAGLLVGNFGMLRSITKTGHGHVMAFWDYAAFLANSVVFILIGSQEAQQNLDLCRRNCRCCDFARADRTRTCGLSALRFVCPQQVTDR